MKKRTIWCAFFMAIWLKTSSNSFHLNKLVILSLLEDNGLQINPKWTKWKARDLIAMKPEISISVVRSQV